MPLVTARLQFDIGQAGTPSNPAVAMAAARFLSLPPDAEAMGRTGVGANCFADTDTTTCFSSGVNIYADVIVRSLERLIRAGVYDQEWIERWQKSYRQRFQLKSEQQRLEFQRQVLTAAYGPEHPYTLTGVITPEAVGRIGKDVLTDFQRSHYTAANATLIVVGAFDVAKVEGLVREHFGAWGSGSRDKPITSEPYQRTGPAFVGVIGKEEPQLLVQMAYPSQAGIDGQEAARQVLTEMLNSRMWDIRAKLGSTYGTYAGRFSNVGPSLYVLGGTVDAPRAGESIKAMRDSIEALRRGEDFDLDFVRARRKIVEDLLGQSTVTGALANRIGQIERFDLDPNYYNNLLQQVAAVSPAQVKALIAAELKADYEVVVTMADRATLVKAFSDAGIKDVKLVEPEYK
jgi:zinc protease